MSAKDCFNLPRTSIAGSPKLSDLWSKDHFNLSQDQDQGSGTGTTTKQAGFNLTSESQKLWPTKPGDLRRGKELFQFAGRATETSVNCSHICPRSNQSLNRTAIWQADKSKRNGKEMLGFIAFINPTAGLPIWWRPSCGPQAPDCLSI